jgi:hypothetical protein
MVDSLETLQAAVHQRNDEHTQSMKSISAGMNALSVRVPELNSFERLPRDLAKQNALLDLTGHSSIQKMLDQADIARSFSTITERFAAVQFAHPARMALASMQDRIREAQVLSVPGIAELSRLAAESSSRHRLSLGESFHCPGAGRICAGNDEESSFEKSDSGFVGYY